MAYELLSLDHMAIASGPWLKLNPSTIEATPDSPGVFEVSNLVRTVLYIGRGEGNLRKSLERFGTLPANLPASIGGYYVRFILVEDEESAVVQRQAAFQASHDGHLPIGNETIPRTSMRLVTRQAA